MTAGVLHLLDGRIQVHVYDGRDIPSLWQDLSPAHHWDPSPWQRILDVETDLDIAPDGWGSLDSASAFPRLEVRGPGSPTVFGVMLVTASLPWTWPSRPVGRWLAPGHHGRRAPGEEPRRLELDHVAPTEVDSVSRASRWRRPEDQAR